MPINIPTRDNEKLAGLLQKINQDEELHQFWRCANVNSIDRSGMSDHGEVHIRIVSNIALKLARLLIEGGVEMSVVKNYGLTANDAEVVVVLAECLHDVGIAIHRHNHETLSLVFAERKARELLDNLYPIRERTIMVSETLHAMVAHRWDTQCLTIEAGVVKVADALDMSEGRTRIPFEAGQINIHSVSAAAIDRVELRAGKLKPIGIEVVLNNSAGIFQIDELLKRKLGNSSIAGYVEVIVRIEGEAEKRLIELYSF